MAPESITNHHVSGVSAGVTSVIHHAAAMPAASAAQEAAFQRPTERETSSADATIRPKKNDQVGMG